VTRGEQAAPSRRRRQTERSIGAMDGPAEVQEGADGTEEGIVCDHVEQFRTALRGQVIVGSEGRTALLPQTLGQRRQFGSVPRRVNLGAALLDLLAVGDKRTQDDTRGRHDFS